MGVGAIVHTLNPRLFLADLEYIVNHAQDKVLLLDLTFVELIKKLQPKLKSVKAFVVLTDSWHMPKEGREVQASTLLTLLLLDIFSFILLPMHVDMLSLLLPPIHLSKN